MEAINGYTIVSLDHKNIALTVLGDLLAKAYAYEPFESKCKTLKEVFQLDEVFVLATCNRISFISYKKGGLGESEPAQMLRQWFNPPVDIENHIQGIRVFNGAEAVKYFFGLKASLDSMIVGEREIVHQMRSAYDTGVELGLCGDHIRLLVEHGIRTVKRIYNETKIGEQPVSVVSIAMRKIGLAKNGKSLRYALVGAGQTMHLVSKFLKKAPIASLDIFNRTPTKGERMARELGGEIHPLDELQSFKKDIDVLIVCTNSKEVLVDEPFAPLHGEGKKIVIDLGVPRNVSEKIACLDHVHYTGIDQLRTVAKANADLRKEHVQVAESIIQEELNNYLSIHLQRQIEKAMNHVPQKIRDVKNRAIDLVFEKQISSLEPDAKDLILEMMDYMEKKCIGIPIKAAKKMVTTS